MRYTEIPASVSFRATTRNPEYPGKNSGRTSRASLLLPLPAPKAGPRIECGVTLSVIPRHDAESRITRARTQDAQAVRPYSSHCQLQKLDPASRCGVTLSSFRATTRNPELSGQELRTHEPCVPTPPTATSRSWTPHRVRGDTLGHSALRRGIQNYPDKNSGRTSRASLLLPLPPPEAGPRIECRVTQCASEYKVMQTDTPRAGSIDFESARVSFFCND